MSWTVLSAPDGGDGDIASGGNFYWQETFSGLHSHPAAFYMWHLPLTDQHISDTNAPEEMLLFPSEMELFPEDTQDGETEWTILKQPED